MTKHSFWDNLVFGSARSRVLDKVDEGLRGIVLSKGMYRIPTASLHYSLLVGSLRASELDDARILFSVPIVMTYSHPVVCGPVLASHPLDLQSFPAGFTSDMAHVGPPAPNMEAKVKGVDEGKVNEGQDPEGEVSEFIRVPLQALIFAQSCLFGGHPSRN